VQRHLDEKIAAVGAADEGDDDEATFHDTLSGALRARA
jgi:hypothetical protein